MNYDDEEQCDEYMITSDNIMLRVFVNLMATDSESQIREKIGEAIRLKYPWLETMILCFFMQIVVN